MYHIKNCFDKQFQKSYIVFLKLLFTRISILYPFWQTLFSLHNCRLHILIMELSICQWMMESWVTCYKIKRWGSTRGPQKGELGIMHCMHNKLKRCREAKDKDDGAMLKEYCRVVT